MAERMADQIRRHLESNVLKSGRNFWDMYSNHIEGTPFDEMITGRHFGVPGILFCKDQSCLVFDPSNGGFTVESTETMVAKMRQRDQEGFKTMVDILRRG